MNQEKPFCDTASLALSVATCAQTLFEGGHQIIEASMTGNHAVIYIAYTPKVKKLCGVGCGSTYYKGAYHFVFQKNIEGVLVRWLQPYFDAQQAAKKVH